MLSSLLAVLVLCFTQTHTPSLEKAERLLVPPPAQIEHFTFGFSLNMADSLWLRTIQDMDYAESHWLYYMLDAVTNLSPDFRIPYATGGVALSVLISDIDYASRFFDKAVKAFPQDWPILYRASYHALYEEKNKAKAAGLLIRAAQNGAPEWAYSLAARLYSDSGNKELALRLYEDLKQTHTDPEILKRIRQKLGISSLTQ